MKYFDVAFSFGDNLRHERVYARGWRIDPDGVLFFYNDSNQDFRAFLTWVTVGPA